MIEIDARGMRCPWPAIRLAKALREHPGRAIEILADDPAAPRELALIAENAGVRLQDAEGDGNHRFRVIP
ncbi:sulfurtransferase TusA family protein [Sphingomonas sp. AOB5]|uniref:sulfurtransferase TusA family protein n=1 Tax=Sphingomonas sp. AOB5 TaxID=3034017 RepID=UPI0023F8B584|nr:sulfurtransferase TusA family protein [Sphingomonas sp. AOB5]MDF7774624.1 sulfurtransferase TusA family protein [Sphingomonas sp. AOB5]